MSPYTSKQRIDTELGRTQGCTKCRSQFSFTEDFAKGGSKGSGGAHLFDNLSICLGLFVEVKVLEKAPEDRNEWQAGAKEISQQHSEGISAPGMHLLVANDRFSLGGVEHLEEV